MVNLSKNGLPSGNLFEYAAYTILNYEKKWKQIKLTEKKEMVKKYWEEKGGKDKGNISRYKLNHCEVFNVYNSCQLNRSISLGKSHTEQIDKSDIYQRSKSAKKEILSASRIKDKDHVDSSKSPKRKKDKKHKSKNYLVNFLEPSSHEEENTKLNTLPNTENKTPHNLNTNNIKTVKANLLPEKYENNLIEKTEKKNTVVDKEGKNKNHNLRKLLILFQKF